MATLVRTDAVVEASVADLQAASQLVNGVTNHAADIALSEKQASILRKAANVILHVRSQIIQARPRKVVDEKYRD